MLEILKNRLISNKEKIFLITPCGEYTFHDLLLQIEKWHGILRAVQSGSIVVHSGGFDLNNISLLIALAEKNCIAVPVSSSDLSISEIIEITKANYYIDSILPVESSVTCINSTISPLLSGPGIIFFTSGSSGKPKAALHDFNLLMMKYNKAHKAYRTCSVLLFDHLAGFDNLFYVLFAGGCLIIPAEFNPNQVLKVIAEHRVQVLSLTPSFLNFMLLQQAELKMGLQNLEIIVFSSEKMPETTLERLKNIIPENIRLIQKYGSTEMGSPSSRTKPDNPLWLKFDPDQVGYQIIDSVLYLKTSSSFQGYLNYKNQNNINEWYCTGDMVETDGEWLHILGRESDQINVGGRKVLPQEVEEVLMGMENVIDVTVMGKDHPLTGNVVKAEIVLNTDEDKRSFTNRMRQFCRDKLAAYKIPVYLEFKKQLEPEKRMKKMRGKNG